MNQKVVLIVSVVVGLLAAFLTRTYLSSIDKEYKDKEKKLMDRLTTMKVTIVNKDLPSGAMLTSSDLDFTEGIKSVFLGKAFEDTNYQVLIGKKIVRQLKKGAVVTWADLEDGDPTMRGLSGDIKKEMRGYSVEVSGAASVSGMVQPNDHVDVLGTYTFPSKEVPGEMELVTLTIMQNVLVLATGKETAKTRLFAANPSGSSYSTVTLEVTPREAEMLDFTKQIKGRLSLTLRNREDIYYETTLPRVNFDKIQAEIEKLNEERQKQIRKPR